MLACFHPFGEWIRRPAGGQEYRGIRTARYTYCRNLAGPWLLYDNEADPYQLVKISSATKDTPEIQRLSLRRCLQRELDAFGDEFPRWHVLHQSVGLSA